MIRRSPTRIELKLEDLQEFDYIQKSDKKKNATNSGGTEQDAQRLLRHERIGYRSTRSATSAAAAAAAASTSNASSSTVVRGEGVEAESNESVVSPDDERNSRDSSSAETVEAVSLNETDLNESFVVRRESGSGSVLDAEADMSLDNTV